MPTPTSDQDEPSRMKKLISGDDGDNDGSVRAKLPPRNGSNSPQRPVSRPPSPPVIYPTSSEPKRRGWPFRFMPAFWTIASLMSMAVNVILIVILLIVFQMLGAIQGTANDKVSGLLGGLYTNFVKMDQANIRTSIHVEKDIPVQFSLNVSGPTNVTLSQPVTISGATVWVQTGGLNIRDANATIVLPAGVILPITIENLVVPVDQKVPAILDVPVDIPLAQTELHEPFVGLQQVVRPWYCLIEPNALLEGAQVCPQMTNPILPTPTPVGTVIP